MFSVSRSRVAVSTATLLPLLVLSACSRGTASPKPDPVAHGRYLVHEVAMCIDCHSPRDERGAFVQELHLSGTALPFAPTVPMPWANAAPALAGLPPGYTDADMVAFLMEGTRPHGKPPTLPPMPTFRLNRTDAEAMTAYLRSLPTPRPQ